LTTLYFGVFAIANPSVVCNVRAPYAGVETFGNISSSFCTLAILWPPCNILRRSSQGNPSAGGVKRRRVEESHLPTSFLYESSVVKVRVTTQQKAQRSWKLGLTFLSLSATELIRCWLICCSASIYSSMVRNSRNSWWRHFCPSVTAVILTAAWDNFLFFL